MYDCVICGKGPKDGIGVFRAGPKGKPAPWACREHLPLTDGPAIHPDVGRIAEILRMEKTNDQ